MEINKPFDENKPDGSTVWENWALVRKVFNDPNKAPNWNDAINGDFNQNVEELRQQLRIKQSKITPQFDPHAPLSKRQGGLSEVRINKTAFDFIVANNLYSQEGQQEFLKNNIMDLKPDAKEVKAVWDTINPKDKDKYHYVIQKDSTGKDIYWGLVVNSGHVDPPFRDVDPPAQQAINVRA